MLTGHHFLQSLLNKTAGIVLSFREGLRGTPLSSTAENQKGQKNSSPLNQRDEEEILFSKKAPGPPDGWKRKQTCRVSSFVLLIRCIASITVPGLFHTTERSFGNCVLKLLEVYTDFIPMSSKIGGNLKRCPIRNVLLGTIPKLLEVSSLSSMTTNDACAVAMSSALYCK
jgi:hypothetical protein